MAELLLVPEVAAGATEVVIAEWLVQAGAEISAGDLIAVIETEKAVVELEAEQGGTLLKTLVAPGTLVGVGLPMALLGSASDVGTDLDALLSSLGCDPSADHGTPAPERRGIPTDESSAAATTARPFEQAAVGRRFVSPIARKLVREAGLALDGIVGTGPGGRVRRRDVESVLAASASSSSVPRSAPDAGQGAASTGWSDVPHSRLRQAIARRLTESKRDVPHFYVKRSARLDALLELRARINESGDLRISVNDLLIKAIALAHRRVPQANVIWTDDAIRQFDSVDISVAVSSERGLVTPVLRGVERSSVSSISEQVRAMVTDANAGTLAQRDLEGGAISISNLGMFGVDEFAAIINPPQSAILAVGAGRPVPVVEDGEVVARTVVDLVLSVDHRAIDGALAATWMAALVDLIEKPYALVA